MKLTYEQEQELKQALKNIASHVTINVFKSSSFVLKR